MVKRYNHSKRTNPNSYTSVTPASILKTEHRSKIYRGREESLILSSGSYFLWYQRCFTSGFECYCYSKLNESGHINCPACFGTGYLESYQKYGYKTFTFTKTWPDTSFGDTTLFVDGFGYGELAVPDGGPAIIQSPIINIKNFKEVDLVQVDEFEHDANFIVEFSYDDIQWFDISCIPLDFSQNDARFRLQIFNGASRFFRLRFREQDFVKTNLSLPEDIYTLVSTEDRYTNETVKERERADNVSETAAWSLEKIQGGDFFVDVSGRLNSLRIDGIYLVAGLRNAVHETQRSELRRDFNLKFIPKNSYAHNLYKVPK